MTQDGEHLRQTLGLVDRNQAGGRIRKSLPGQRSAGRARRTFEIEVRPFRQGVAGKRALAALPRPHQEDGGKRPEEGVKTIGMQSLDIFHTLQFSTNGSKLQGIVLYQGNLEKIAGYCCKPKLSNGVLKPWSSGLME